MPEYDDFCAFKLYGINTDLEIELPWFPDLPDFPYPGPYFPPRLASGGGSCERYTGNIHDDFIHSVRSFVGASNLEGERMLGECFPIDAPSEENIPEKLWDMRIARMSLESTLEKLSISSAPWHSDMDPVEGDIRYGLRGPDGRIDLLITPTSLPQGSDSGDVQAASATEGMQGVEHTAPQQGLGVTPHPAPQMGSQTSSPMPAYPGWTSPWNQPGNIQGRGRGSSIPTSPVLRDYIPRGRGENTSNRGRRSGNSSNGSRGGNAPSRSRGKNPFTRGRGESPSSRGQGQNPFSRGRRGGQQ